MPLFKMMQGRRHQLVADLREQSDSLSNMLNQIEIELGFKVDQQTACG